MNIGTYCRILACVSALLSTGCFMFMAPKSNSPAAGAVPPEEVEAAIKAEDYAKLKDLCNEVVPIASEVANYHSDACEAAIRLAEARDDAGFLRPLCSKREELLTGQDHNAVCPAAMRLAIEQDDRAYLKSMCEADKFEPACRTVKLSETFADVAAPDCSTLAGRVVEARKSFLSASEAAPEELAPVIAALARCGDGATIFETIAPEGEWHFDGYGGQALLAADKTAGPELFGTFEAYMKAKAGAGFLDGSGYAAHHVAGWLLRTKRMELCRPLAATLKHANERVVANIFDYFKQTQCKEAAPLAVKLLASDEAEFRAWGCDALALLGDRSHLKKLGVVADTDSASRLVEHSDGEGTVYTKEFFVADSCRAAIAKIKLRSE